MIDRQVRAAHHPQHDSTMLDSGQRDRILLATQEALGPIDGIEHPVRLGRCIVITGIDRCEYLFCRDFVLNQMDGTDDGLANRRMLVSPQRARRLFCCDHGAIERLLQPHGDDRL